MTIFFRSISQFSKLLVKWSENIFSRRASKINDHNFIMIIITRHLGNSLRQFSICTHFFFSLCHKIWRLLFSQNIICKFNSNIDWFWLLLMRTQKWEKWWKNIQILIKFQFVAQKNSSHASVNNCYTIFYISELLNCDPFSCVVDFILKNVRTKTALKTTHIIFFCRKAVNVNKTFVHNMKILLFIGSRCWEAFRHTRWGKKIDDLIGESK